MQLKLCFRKLFFLFLLTAQVICSPLTIPSPYKIKFRRLNITGLKSPSRITCIYKDHIGFMWFGTPKGLIKYDGSTIKLYKHIDGDTTSISENYINFIMEDSKNNLWIGTLGGGINLYHRETDSFSQLLLPERENAQLGYSIAYCMAEDSSGSLWFGFDTDGLVQYFPEQDIAINYKYNDRIYPNCLTYNDVRSLCVDSSNTLWIGTAGGGLTRLDIEKGIFKHYTHSPKDLYSISSNNIRKLYLDSEHNLWIGTFDNGINLYDRKRDRFIRFTHDPTNPHSISDNTVFSIVEDLQGNLWIGTEIGGLNLFDKKAKRFFSYKHNPLDPLSISHNSVDYLFVDEIGTIWIGTYAGGVNLFNLELENFDHYYFIPMGNSLSSNIITSFAEDGEGNIWIGTDGGGLNLWDRNTFYHPGTLTGGTVSPPDSGILCLLLDDNQNLWMGTYRNGITILDTKTRKFRRYAYTNGDLDALMKQDIRHLYQDKNGNIWIGGPGLGICYYDKKLKKLVKPNIKLPDLNLPPYHYIYYIYQDYLGDIWLGTYGMGLYRLNLPSMEIDFYLYSEKDSSTINSNFIYCINEDSKNRLWIGTRNGLNLFLREHNIFKRINIPPLNGTEITGIVEDDKGNLWIGTGNGLVRFNYDTGKFRRFTEEDGLQGNEFWKGAFLKLSTGEILFGGTNGFNIFNPNKFKTNTKPPNIVVSKIELLEENIEQNYIKSLYNSLFSTSRIELPYHLNSFSITFSALNYWISNKNQYAYIIKGKHKKWIHLGNTGKITFIGMSPGKHRLVIKASNNDGIWNEKGKEITIKIIPPFYRTTTFYASIFLLLAIGVSLYIRWRLNIIRKRNIILSQINKQLEEEIQRRIEAEETLRKSEEKYREVVENAPFGIVIHRDWKIIYYNKAAMDIFKIKSRDEFIGKNPLSFVKDEHKDIAIQRIKEQYEKLVPAPPVEETLLRTDGEEFPAIISAIPVKTHDSHVDSHVFITDISQRKKTEEERQKLRDQLEQAQKLEAIGQLAGGIAHDFNNILTVILGYIDILQNQKSIEETSPAYKFISATKNAAMKAKELVNQLLAFGRKQAYTPTVLNINDLIENTKEMVRRLISEDIELIFSPAEKIPTIYADPGQIEQILINLIINARDAILEKKTPSEKKIIIQTNHLFLDKTYTQAHFDAKEGHYICISVTDTGIGMSEEIKAKIFDPFFTTKERGKGTGMGLSTVYGIVKQNGGIINVYSEPGKGTTFKIYWPAQEYEVETIEEKHKPAGEDELIPGSGQILFVEDEEAIRELTSETLQTLGYKVTTTDTANEALEILEKTNGNFDLIITDVIMPGISGTEMAEIVREKYPHIKILFTSGYAEEYITQDNKYTGTEFLTKPYTISQLSKKIHNLLSRKEN